MGLISRVSSRTYRKRKRKFKKHPTKWPRKLSANTRFLKSETRNSPETRSTDSFESETAAGDDPKVSIVPSDDDSVVKLATQVSVTEPTKTPGTPAETIWDSRNSWSTMLTN